MQIELESALQRWTEARLLDQQLAGRIREFEANLIPSRRARWPVMVALAFGGVMLAAGVLLFVSAHWDQLSPTERMTVLTLSVAGFHIAGASTSERFRALGTTMHAVGTASLGGAILLAGQTFNMQEHWPAGILLWTIGAVAGWFLFRDWPHAAMMAILAPWYLIGEWTLAVTNQRYAGTVPAAWVLLLAICYLSGDTAGRETRNNPARIALKWLGGLALLPAAVMVAVQRTGEGSQNTTVEIIGWAGAILIPLAFSFLLRGSAAWMNVAASVWAIGLAAVAGQPMEILVYLWCVIGSAAMIGWGVYEFRTERINLGMAGFALTLIFFFFSSVMDKLGRSASLISLGALFVAGGWYWEKARRGLVARVRLGGAQ